MEITRAIELDYGHTLPSHYHFCNQVHGHRAKIEATIDGAVNNTPGDSSEGMVFDFKILKELMMSEIHDVLDHGFAVWKNDTLDLEFITKRNKRYIVTEEPPTAEYLAKWAFKQLQAKLPKELTLIKIAWYETPTCCAVYTQPAL